MGKGPGRRPEPRPEGRGRPSAGPAEAVPALVGHEDALPTVYLKPGEADRVVGGHPWIYEGALLRVVREPEDGGVVQVKDHRRRLLGVGFYNARSRIRVRVLAWDRVELDEAFFERRLRQALEHRLRHLPGATSYRWVNAEGDLLSGLIVDRYEDVLVVQMSSAGMEKRKAMLVRLLEKLGRPRAIVERNDMTARRFEGLEEASGVLVGAMTEAERRAWPVRVNGLQFEADLVGGHKTGLYLDQQVNQALVAAWAKGAEVLDAFSFQGGFALAAARAGAKSVLGLDQSAEAVAVAERMAAANGLEALCSFRAVNVFDWMREAAASGSEGARPEPRFDLIVLDPPSFTRNRASVPDALRGYKEIHLRALRLLRPGGLLATFCCSHHVDAGTFEGTILEAAYDARRQLRRVAAFGQAADHPVLPAVPESEYLKGFLYELLSP